MLKKIFHPVQVPNPSMLAPSFTTRLSGAAFSKMQYFYLCMKANANSFMNVPDRNVSSKLNKINFLALYFFQVKLEIPIIIMCEVF